jgi:hypothetical protein
LSVFYGLNEFTPTNRIDDRHFRLRPLLLLHSNNKIIKKPSINRYDDTGKAIHAFQDVQKQFVTHSYYSKKDFIEACNI